MLCLMRYALGSNHWMPKALYTSAIVLAQKLTTIDKASNTLDAKNVI